MSTSNSLRAIFTVIAIVLSFQFSFAQKSPNDFVFTIKTDNPGYSNDSSYFLNAPYNTGIGFNYDVDWNDDGVFDSLGASSSILHTYPQPGIYTIRIKGNFPILLFGSNGNLNDKSKLISIDQWGNQVWRELSFAFSECDSLLTTPLDTPNLSQVNSLGAMFKGASSFNGPVNHWDVSSIFGISAMFERAHSFNQPLNNWTVDSIRSFSYLFKFAFSFNQPLNNWNVSSAEYMSDMFQGAINFNQNIDSWDVTNVITMREMFASAYSFNQPLNSWVISSVTNMSRMFMSADNFNQPLNNWNTIYVTRMENMFNGADSFNQSLNSWSFVSIQNNVGLNGFLNSTGMSVNNYDSLLIYLNQSYSNKSWRLGAYKLKYCNGANARANLIANGWSFFLDSLNCSVGINENTIKKSIISVHPNPASNQLQMGVDKSQIGERLQLFNTQGQMVKETIIRQERMLLGVDEYPNGLYFLRVGERSQKVLIQH